MCRRRPIFPGSFPPSIFGTIELNYRVRDGNGWNLNVIDTGYISRFHVILQVNIYRRDFCFELVLVVTRTRFELVLPA